MQTKVVGTDLPISILFVAGRKPFMPLAGIVTV
jgi:hypothetical protein